MERLLYWNTELQHMEFGISIRGWKSTRRAHPVNSEANNNTHTADIQSTLDQLMDYFIPEDSASSDGAHHKRVRELMTEPMHTTDDIPFTQPALEKLTYGRLQVKMP